MSRTGAKSLALLLFTFSLLPSCAHQAAQPELAPPPAEAPRAEMAPPKPKASSRTVMSENFRQALRLGDLSPLDLRIVGTGEHPVLEGQVYSAEQKAALENVVLAFKGVRSVTNNLQIVPPPPPPVVTKIETSRLQWVLISALSLLSLFLLAACLRLRSRLRRERAMMAASNRPLSELRSISKAS